LPAGGERPDGDLFKDIEDAKVLAPEFSPGEAAYLNPTAS
jgi:hypothetical protein